MSGYERALLHEALIAKYVAWLLWLAMLGAVVWAILHGGWRNWVLVSVVTVFTFWAAWTEGQAVAKLKELAVQQGGGMRR